MRPKLIIAIVAVLLLVTTDGTPAQSPETSTAKKIDAVFSAVASPDAPGLAVLVRQNGQPVFERGYGVRDLGSKARIDPHSNFRLASFTKQFTAMAIMLLVHDGKLRYDESLAEIFPDFPAYGKSITIRNLLNHTSGLPDYEDLIEAAEKSEGTIWTPEKQIQDVEVLELLKKREKREIHARNKLVVQQFRLRRARTHRRESFKKHLRRISSSTNFFSAQNESHRRLRKNR